MSTKNKKSIASQALLDMDAITNAIKEESKKSISLLLSEAVKDALREGCEKEEEEKDYDVIDDETTDAKIPRLLEQKLNLKLGNLLKKTVLQRKHLKPVMAARKNGMIFLNTEAVMIMTSQARKTLTKL